MSFNKMRSLIVLSLLMTLSGCGSEQKAQTGAVVENAISGSSVQANRTKAYGATVNEVLRDAQGRFRNSLKAPSNQTYYFAFDNSTIRVADVPALRAQARYLAVNKDAKIVLSGYTDERGSPEYNIGLGVSRDDSVAGYLMDLGVARDQIREVSFGEMKPAARGHNEDAWVLNRRVELEYKGL